MLTWQTTKNLINSLKYYLDTEISSDSVTDNAGDVIPVRIGRKDDDNWTLPCIAIYKDDETNEKIFIGSNQTDDRRLIVIDLFAEDEGQREDVADWLVTKLTDGWRYYTYTVNINTPLNPSKIAAGWVSIDFLTNTRVNLGQNVSLFDQNRHRITVDSWIS
ncbi:MAG TPA: hypothetical protein VMX17_10145 [Candidatus Glassbacteria bacterium]|nr:hypothetical protein [Candidatus Glassbacteria bacterium]